jgi:hypothetical protein
MTDIIRVRIPQKKLHGVGGGREGKTRIRGVFRS